MPDWSDYPADYRQAEVQSILAAVRAGECVAVVGLSGAGKSNLAAFVAQRAGASEGFVLVDCNRLGSFNPGSFFQLIRRALDPAGPAAAPEGDELAALEQAVNQKLEALAQRLCLIFDRFDSLPLETRHPLYGNLRALRDGHKYRLTYVPFTRRPLDGRSELAELFYAHTLWLGPLSESDARWSIDSYRQRSQLPWDAPVYDVILEISGRYPALLRAACEAIAAGCPPKAAALRSHPTVRRRVEEILASATAEDLRHSGLEGHSLLAHGLPESELTAKEALLLKYLQAHPNQVCEKDELMRAVWPEVKVYDEGLQDDSLAQLVRRLRRKIEPDPSNPTHIVNVPGRGYRFTV
jgi:ABC-type cobalamin/Fe3+-siderophores transport system ATPase subunit